MTLREILTAARARIATLKQFTRFAEARTLNGVAVLSEDAGATCWCASGSVFATVPIGPERRAAIAALNDAADDLTKGQRVYVSDVNDDVGLTWVEAHAAVLKVFDRAIERAA